jgi:hypothetical protein
MMYYAYGMVNEIEPTNALGPYSLSGFNLHSFSELPPSLSSSMCYGPHSFILTDREPNATVCQLSIFQRGPDVGLRQGMR